MLYPFLSLNVKFVQAVGECWLFHRKEEAAERIHLPRMAEVSNTYRQEASRVGPTMRALEMEPGHRVVQSEEAGGMEGVRPPRMWNESAPPPLMLVTASIDNVI